ncbi:hypothetical protein E4U59_007598 [Claviceps monticola]|nr:hypothetical protein E4U59_007598 [Claviceps monticola]
MANRIRAYTDKAPTLERFREDFKDWFLSLFSEQMQVSASVSETCSRRRRTGISAKKGSGDSVPKILFEIVKFGTADPMFPPSPAPVLQALPTTLSHPVNETPIQIMQQTLQQLLQSQTETQQMQQATMQQMLQQMQQMMQQMTKLTVKQPTPGVSTPTRQTQDSNKDPTGTYKLTFVNTASDKSDTSMPDAALPLHQTTHRGVTEKDPDITMHDASPSLNQVRHRNIAEKNPDTTRLDAPPMRKSITPPTVQEFAPAPKEYLYHGGSTRAQSIFPQ